MFISSKARLARLLRLGLSQRIPSPGPFFYLYDCRFKGIKTTLKRFLKFSASLLSSVYGTKTQILHRDAGHDWQANLTKVLMSDKIYIFSFKTFFRKNFFLLFPTLVHITVIAAFHFFSP
jgi:glycogen synthase